jgi:ribonuclease BN (tRNA processing enzyme)
MELTFVGTGSAFNPVLENSNAFFTLGDRLYIIDCGETAFGKYWDLPALRNASEITVVITHLHCDHVGSLGSLVSYCYLVLKKRIRIVHPLDTIVKLLDLMGIKRECYEYLERLPDVPGEPVSFEPVQVDHVDNMVCYGYVISAGEDAVYYSGDATAVPPRVLEAFRAGSTRTPVWYPVTTRRTVPLPTWKPLSGRKNENVSPVYILIPITGISWVKRVSPW